MSRKVLPYKEGDLFAIPLGDGCYGLGLIARMGTRGGVVLGYFFGPCRSRLPSTDDTLMLRPIDAVLICQFCNPALVNGEWPIVPRSDKWCREDWPQPAFGHIDVVDKSKAYKREYPYNNPSDLFIKETPVSLEEARRLPQDGLYGHLALQSMLTKLLSV